MWGICRSPWPRVLRSRSAAARLLRSWVRIPSEAWISVCCECRVLSGRGLCDALITRPEESYRLWRVVVCDLETGHGPRWTAAPQGKKYGEFTLIKRLWVWMAREIFRWKDSVEGGKPLGRLVTVRLMELYKEWGVLQQQIIFQLTELI